MIVIVLIILGLSFGSFVNALVWRIYKQWQNAESNKLKKHKTSSRKFSILYGRSMCVQCAHTLEWYDLVPIISWVSLRGKCRYCHKPISYQYPLVEISTGILFVTSYIFWPKILNSPPSILLISLWLIILTGLVALVVYDLRWMILPDRIVFPLQFIALIFVLTKFFETNSDVHVFIGAIVGVLCSAGLFYLLYQLSKGKWIGGGDVKLAIVLGLVLGGAFEALLMLFVASALGSLIGIPLIVAKKTKLQNKLPFGPLLVLATIIVVLFGTSMIDWYKAKFLII